VNQRAFLGTSLGIALLAVVVLAAPAGAVQFSLAHGANGRCLDCHSKPDRDHHRQRRAQEPDGRGKRMARLGALAPGLHGVSRGLPAERAHGGGKDGWYEQAKLTACSDCHADQFTMYSGSFHGNVVMREHDKRAPSCGDCHGSHGIIDNKSPGFRASVLHMCGRCHEEKAGTYLDTYHGKAFRMGDTGVFFFFFFFFWVWSMEMSHGLLIAGLFFFGGMHCFMYFYRGLREGLYSRGEH